MLALTATSAAAGSLAGAALATSSEIVPYQENVEQLKICHYGFKEFVLITPLVQELARYGLESLTAVVLSRLGQSMALYGPACAISTLFGLLHFYSDPDSTPLSSTAVVLKSACYSFLRGTFGLPSALIAHSAHNFFEYMQSKRSWEGVRARSEREFLQFAQEKVLKEAQQNLAVVQQEEELPFLFHNRERPKNRNRKPRSIEWKTGLDRTEAKAQKAQQTAARNKKNKEPPKKQEFEMPIFKPENFPLLLTAP
jgi:hypothetical protein